MSFWTPGRGWQVTEDQFDPGQGAVVRNIQDSLNVNLPAVGRLRTIGGCKIIQMLPDLIERLIVVGPVSWALFHGLFFHTGRASDGSLAA
jgi:hypothetical protein